MAVSSPAATDSTDANHTAGRMSKGVRQPAAARTEAMVVGSNWMEAVFSTTSRHSSSLATPSQPLAMRRAARMPSGVAALPRPSRLAETLAEMAASVSSSRLASGSSRRSRGRKVRASPWEIPQTFMISMIPLHKHSIPAMETLRSMADWAPAMAAFATSSRFPDRMPNIRDSTTIPVQIQAIAIRNTPLLVDFIK